MVIQDHVGAQHIGTYWNGQARRNRLGRFEYRISCSVRRRFLPQESCNVKPSNCAAFVS